MTEPTRLTSAAEVRKALREWAEKLMHDELPTAKVVDTPEGQVQALPVLGFAWTGARPLDDRPRPIAALNDGRGIWRVYNEEADFAFTWRAKSFNEAEVIAQQFIGRAHTEAARKRDDGNRTIDLEFTIADAPGYKLAGRLYIFGSVEPFPMERAQLRDEWIVKVPALVTYPVVFVESLDDKSGAIRRIDISINGVVFTATPQE